jgi:hypothetical protein
MSSVSSPGSHIGVDPSSNPSRLRLLGFRVALVFAGLLPLMWGVSSVQGALGGGTHLVHDLVAAGVVLSMLWLAPLVAMWRPWRFPPALLCYLVFVFAGVIAAVLSSSNVEVAVILALQAGLVTLAHPARRAAMRGSVVISPLLMPVALLAAAGLARYAVAEAALQASGDSHAIVAHYFDQAWYALAVALLGVLAALRGDVRRFAGMASGLALAAFGVVSVALPTVSSSLGSVWGVVTLVTGVGIVALVAVEGRRAPSAHATPSPAA